MNDLLIMVAPTGARRSKRDHPNLPITPGEIGETALRCLAAGAGAIHLHVRDAGGVHSLDPVAYRAAIAAVRTGCGADLVIQATTESASRFGLAEQIASLRALVPEAASIALRELFREGDATALELLRWAETAGVALQYILYDEQDIEHFAALQAAGRIPGPREPRIILVLGRYGDNADSSIGEFQGRLRALERHHLTETTVWSVCAFGRGELACLEAAMRAGGHVRVGFENAIVDAGGRPAIDNAERVSLVAEIAQRIGRTPVFGDRARAILGLADAA